MKPTALNPVLPGAETAARGVPDDVVLRVQRQLLGRLEGEAALAAAVLVRVPLRHQRAAQQRRGRGRRGGGRAPLLLLLLLLLLLSLSLSLVDIVTLITAAVLRRRRRRRRRRCSALQEQYQSLEALGVDRMCLEFTDGGCGLTLTTHLTMNFGYTKQYCQVS